MFTSFFDDAAIFPPGNAPMDDAVLAHLDRRDTADGEFVGPFVCSAARLDELFTSLGGRQISVALVSAMDDLDAALAELADHSQATLSAVELKGATDDLPDLPRGVPVFVERAWDASFDVPPGALLKLRCGGAGPADVPSAEQLAAAIEHCVSTGVGFKLTAGLHHALPAFDPSSGVPQHGFLNVLAAVSAVIHHADPVPLLLETDPEALKIIDPDAVRRLLRSIGTCSIAEPLADLRHLALIA